MDSLLWSIPWAHHVILMQKVKDHATRRWCMERTITNGWSRNILALQIDALAHERHGKAVSNFAATLPPAQSDLARQTLKDPSIFDFLTIAEPFHERELETELVKHVQRFLLKLGQGFAFVGRQHRLDQQHGFVRLRRPRPRPAAWSTPTAICGRYPARRGGRRLHMQRPRRWALARATSGGGRLVKMTYPTESRFFVHQRDAGSAPASAGSRPPPGFERHHSRRRDGEPRVRSRGQTPSTPNGAASAYAAEIDDAPQGDLGIPTRRPRTPGADSVAGGRNASDGLSQPRISIVLRIMITVGRAAGSLIRSWRLRLMPMLPEQAEALEFLSELDDFLAPRSLLFWGNLLGAVRHGGFIPWDDDLDLLLDRVHIPALEMYCGRRGIAIARHPWGFLKLHRPDGRICRPDLPWRWPFIDVFPYDLVMGEVRTQLGVRKIRLPASQVLPPRPMYFAGALRLAPACPIPILRTLYGDYETYNIKTYDHRNERTIALDEIVERVNASYWRQSSADQEHPHSSFAVMAADVFAEGDGRVLDIGSGEGRDARYFRSRGLEVDECDPFVGGKVGDALTVCLANHKRIYCRWLLHTLSRRQRHALVDRLDGASRGTLVCLEFRDPADAINLTRVANDPELTFDDGHFRWLVPPGEVLGRVGSGYDVIHHSLGRFSRMPHSDPILTRLVLKKTR